MPAVRVDRIWQVVGGCARSKRNPKRQPYLIMDIGSYPMAMD